MAFTFERAPGISKEVGNWSATVREVGGMDPQIVIGTDQAWEIHVEFEEGGVAEIPGNWVVDAYVESIGLGAEQKVGTHEVAFKGPLLPPRTFDFNIAVPAGTPALAAGEETTPYLLIVTLTANNGLPVGAGRQQYSMAGYEMGPVLQFYKA